MNLSKEEVLEEIRTKASDAMESGISPETYKTGFTRVQ